jgi:hypothetical protein
MQLLFKNLFNINYYKPMIVRQDIVFSLILAPIRSGLRGFCLTPLISPLGKGGRRGVDWISAKETAQILCPTFYLVYD